jgi:hypothetical protein
VELLHDGVLVPILAREPLIKGLRVAKDVGKEKVEKGPELVQVVLEGGAGDEEPVARVE